MNFTAAAMHRCCSHTEMRTQQLHILIGSSSLCPQTQSLSDFKKKKKKSYKAESCFVAQACLKLLCGPGWLQTFNPPDSTVHTWFLSDLFFGPWVCKVPAFSVIKCGPAYVASEARSLDHKFPPQWPSPILGPYLASG